MSNNRNIEPLFNTPLNHLFFAINHYVSTGDHIGEGVAIQNGDGTTRVFIPVRDEFEDKENLKAFKSRFDEVASQFGCKWLYMGNDSEFDLHGFDVPESQIEELGAAIKEKPGPLGWGTLKGVIDKNFPSQ